MAGFRDKVAHGYFGVDLEVVWDTAVEDAPFLKLLISKILDEKEKEKERNPVNFFVSRVSLPEFRFPSFASGARGPFRSALLRSRGLIFGAVHFVSEIK